MKKHTSIDAQAPAAAPVAHESAPLPIRIPLFCRVCGRDELVEYPIPVVVVALTRWNNLLLHACCSDASWDATAAELQRIRAHLGAAWLESFEPR